MKLFALALDSDGTIARDDQIDPSIRDVIALASTRGISVLLVTGRILSELRRVAGELHFVDGVVAENGAVVHFPESDHTSVLAPVAPRAFLDELTRRGIDCHALAADLRAIESRHRANAGPDTVPDMGRQERGPFGMRDDGLMAAG